MIGTTTPEAPFHHRINQMQERGVDERADDNWQGAPTHIKRERRRQHQINPPIAELADRYGEPFCHGMSRHACAVMNGVKIGFSGFA
jgi:hypothetical protein